MKPDCSAEMCGYYFDVQKYRASDKVRLMDIQTRGIYREVLDEIWVTGSIPNDPEKIAKLLHISAEIVLNAWPQILECLIPTKHDPERLTSDKMEEERRYRNRIRQKNSKAGRASAEQRRNKRSTGVATGVQPPLNSPTPTPTPTPTPIPKEKGSGKRRTGVPKEFPISDDMRAWALQDGFTDLDIHRETPAMLDHFRGKGETKLDWIATWRNWLRNSRKFGASNGNGTGPKSKTELNAEAGARALAKFNSQSGG